MDGRGEWRKDGQQGRRGQMGRRRRTGGEGRNGTGTWGRREEAAAVVGRESRGGRTRKQLR